MGSLRGLQVWSLPSKYTEPACSSIVLGVWSFLSKYTELTDSSGLKELIAGRHIRGVFPGFTQRRRQSHIQLWLCSGAMKAFYLLPSSADRKQVCDWDAAVVLTPPWGNASVNAWCISARCIFTLTENWMCDFVALMIWSVGLVQMKPNTNCSWTRN